MYHFLSLSLIVACLCNIQNSFWSSVMAIDEKYEDKDIVTMMINSQLYDQSDSSTEEYALLTSYILFCNDEDASEGIGARLYLMLESFPEKWEVMNRLWDNIPVQKQNELKLYFAGIIMFEYSQSQRSMSKDDFYSRFPFMKTVKIPLEKKSKGEDLYDFWEREHGLQRR